MELRIISIRLLSVFVILLLLVSWRLPTISAQTDETLTSQEKSVGNYTVTFEASADREFLSESDALSYIFRLVDQNGKNAPYDSAYVDFSTKSGTRVMNGWLTGVNSFTPGAIMSLGMPSAGPYQVDIIFVNHVADGSTNELAKASFDFEIPKMLTSASSTPKRGVYPVPWALLLVAAAIGAVFGRIFAKLD